jgi:hypothetical protein
MDQIEIDKYLQVGSNRSICVDRRVLHRYPGLVRDVRLKGVADVLVEINSHGYDEGGLIIRLVYTNIAEAISALEDYLEKPLSEWENVTKTDSYPHAIPNANLQLSGVLLKEDLKKWQLDLPKNWLSREVAQGYWRDVIEGRAG